MDISDQIILSKENFDFGVKMACPGWNISQAAVHEYFSVSLYNVFFNLSPGVAIIDQTPVPLMSCTKYNFNGLAEINGMSS